MSSTPTLNSRLRVLVAKTFRAEKLYSSIRNTSKDNNPSGLSEVANDVRAKEWQTCHYVLRVALNDILTLPSGEQQASEVLRLREEFSKKADESFQHLEQSATALTELAQRQEFAHALKLSVELIRHKARAQASRVISDELNALLSASARNTDASQLGPAPEKIIDKDPAKVSRESDFEPALPANVVSLNQRRAAGGSRRGR